MKITKIKIKNLFGIKEYETDGRDIELLGKNGVGKTSVIDAIRYALTNKSDREYIVRNGENEGEILIETDNNIKISRKKRTEQVDYKSIKKDGREVGSPESFLRDIFTPLQLSPVEFMEMDRKKQNAIILDMIQYDWDMNKIREWFGEIPSWVSYEQNILAVLNDIQSEDGEYFQERQNINRDIRNKLAFIAEIADSIPAGYEADKWETASVGEIYRDIEKIRKDNETIYKAKAFIENRDNKIRSYEAEKEIEISSIDREFSAARLRLTEQIAKLKEQIESCNKELLGLDGKKQDKIALAEEKYKANIAKYESAYEQYKEYAGLEEKSTAELEDRAAYIEDMKGHINEYRRMESLQDEVEDLKAKSRDLTSKIGKARELPGEILQKAVIPIKGLTVKDGVPLINGLPVSNLSEGEKLDLCIDVAIEKPNGLQIILIDGVEKLATSMREALYKKCKEKNLQFIATRTTDDEGLTIIEL